MSYTKISKKKKKLLHGQPKHLYKIKLLITTFTSDYIYRTLKYLSKTKKSKNKETLKQKKIF